MAQWEMDIAFAQYEDVMRGILHWIRDIAEQFLKTRKETIRVMKEFWEGAADRIHQECSAVSRNASLTGVLGGGLRMVAGGLIFSTGGLATPLVIGGLTYAGGACSFGGGGWAVKNELNRGQRMSELQQEILNQIAEDNKAVQEMNEILQKIRNGDFGRPDRILRELHAVFAGAGCIRITLRSTEVLDELSQYVVLPVSYFLTPQTHKFLSLLVSSLTAENGAFRGQQEVAQQCASPADAVVKDVCRGLSKKIVHRKALKAAGTAYKEAIEEAMEKAAQKAANEAAKKGGDLATQKAAAQGAQQAAKKAAKGTAAKAATTAFKEGMKTAAKVTGAITAGFGALTFLWEGYNAVCNHHASQEKSPLGRELRDLADQMKVSLLRFAQENTN